jgi:hypothetical protein
VAAFILPFSFDFNILYGLEEATPLVRPPSPAILFSVAFGSENIVI